MTYKVTTLFTVKTKQGDLTLNPGQVVTLAEEKAKKLIEDGKIQPLPYLDNGTLRIPFDSPQKYYWWDRGQSIKDTLRELGASDEILKRYQSPYSDN